MSVFSGPDVVKSGLVLALDAGNRKSYPGSGTTWTDLTGRGNNATLTNGPTYNSSNGGSIVFDGVNDIVSSTSNLTLGGSFSISLWLKHNRTNSFKERYITLGDERVVIQGDENSNLNVYISDGTEQTLWNWGSNSNGQLGVNNTTSRSTPVTTLFGGSNWKQISGGGNHIAAIKTDGTLWIYGYNASGQLGVGDETSRSTPVTTILGGTNWKSVSCGYAHVAAIKNDGTLWNWGSSLYGQLGINDLGFVNTPTTTILGGTNWQSVTSGYFYTTAIKTDGSLWLWGNNSYGQLGINESTGGSSRSTPVTTILGGTNWKTLGCGVDHNTAIKTDGSLWVWGYNNFGALGVNDNEDRYTPVTTLLGGNNWKSINSGYSFNVATKTDGTLWSWGLNTYGQLGVNDRTARSTPVTTILGGNNWRSSSCKYRYVSAIKTDGTLWSWGFNSNGQLGTNDIITRSTPVTTLLGGTNWKSINCGGYHNIALKSEGQNLFAFGTAAFGQLGINDGTTNRNTPVTTILGGTNWQSISAAYRHRAGIKSDGTLWTWGYGFSGQLGTNDGQDRDTPVTTLLGGTNWRTISSGGYQTAAIKTDGTLWNWGKGNFGALGTNETSNRSTPVTTILGGTNWKFVSCGGYHTSAIKTDGTLWLWGDNSFGQLGINDSTGNRIYTPVTTLLGGTNWESISNGWYHTAATKTDGSLWLWGYNSFGQLGINDDVTDRLTPITTLPGGTNWRSVSAGYHHTTAIKTDGSLWLWGYNYFGQLGVNDVVSRSTPVTTILGGTNWFSTSSNGHYLTAAIKTDGTLWTWGSNTSGPLGVNGTITRSTPVTTILGGNNWRSSSCGYRGLLAIKGVQTFINDDSISYSSSNTNYTNIVVTSNGTTLKVYQNSSLLLTSTLNGTLSSTPLSYTISNTIDAFSGNLSSIQVYSKELSTSEVQQNFNAIRGRFGI